MKKVRAVILARKMSTEPDLYPTKYLKGYLKVKEHTRLSMEGRTDDSMIAISPDRIGQGIKINNNI